jgi:uncharacterized protein (DUF1684 family)
MKFVKFLLAITFFGAVNLSAQETIDQYSSMIIGERLEKDLEFIDEKQSPLTDAGRSTFEGLAYFAPDKKFLIEARLERISSPDTIKMKTTTERLPLYLVYGKAYFTIDGQEQVLTIYQNVGLMTKEGYEDYLFVPFTDETNGETTYGGGRYIDTRIGEGDKIILDFNKAYNPYCAYNKKYSCPIPPRENHVTVEIKAGELKYH